MRMGRWTKQSGGEHANLAGDGLGAFVWIEVLISQWAENNYFAPGRIG